MKHLGREREGEGQGQREGDGSGTKEGGGGVGKGGAGLRGRVTEGTGVGEGGSAKAVLAASSIATIALRRVWGTWRGGGERKERGRGRGMAAGHRKGGWAAVRKLWSTLALTVCTSAPFTCNQSTST